MFVLPPVLSAFSRRWHGKRGVDFPMLLTHRAGAYIFTGADWTRNARFAGIFGLNDGKGVR